MAEMFRNELKKKATGLGKEMFVVFFIHEKQDKLRRTKHLTVLEKMVERKERINFFFFFF